MTQKRILLNAKQVLLDKLVFYNQVLYKKYVYLEKQQFLLVDHFVLKIMYFSSSFSFKEHLLRISINYIDINF